MSKLLLMASMWVMILWPLRASRSSDAMRGFKAAMVGGLVFNLVWAAVVLAIFLMRVGDPNSLLPPQAEP